MNKSYSTASYVFSAIASDKFFCASCSNGADKQLPNQQSNVEQFGLLHEGSGLLVADYRAVPSFCGRQRDCQAERRILTIHELDTGLPSEVIIATALIMEYFEKKRTGLRDNLPGAAAF